MAYIGQAPAVSVANSQISGNIISSQITSVANSQITGNIISTQITSVANSQITGNILITQIQPAGATAGVYGSTSVIPVITVDYAGRLSLVANATPSFASTGKAIALAIVMGF